MAEALLPPGTDNAVVALDPTQPVDPKPLVADILRTKYCIPGSVFLVEAIENEIPVGSRYRAVRLVLGDGELCVQAILRPEIHRFVDGGQVYEGCYVRVDRFEMNEVKVGEEGQEMRMVYLLVQDMVTVGWNRDYLRLLGVSEPQAVGVTEEVRGLKAFEGREARDGIQREDSRARQPFVVVEAKHPAAMSPAMQATNGPTFTPRKPQVQKGTEVSPTRKTGPAFTPSKSPAPKILGADEGISDSDDDFETLQVTAERAAGRRIRGSQTTSRSLSVSKGTATSKDATNKSLPWMAKDLTQPLKLTNLCSIPNLPYKQNWMCNILAVVASLSELEPSHLPPHSQRTARLTDPTTAKEVLLTVFLDPEAFTPKIGSVVLLTGVKNHRFDGGSLKKYVSDKPKNGTSWWIRNPEALSWCQVEAIELRDWWEGKQMLKET